MPQKACEWDSFMWRQIIINVFYHFIGDPNDAGVRKGADSYFPPEDRVRLVRLVSHGELPGEGSGGSIIEYSWNNL